ncbi:MULTISPECIES: hypothetical protein [Sphingobacterium]|jgi:hypothetical protein|uniref:hypothetical protein n=1 Tax=Sphingobacterium TaxID=28453 RepID=UPI000B495C0B|nr:MULTISPECIES: hypothetical protein [Sphingobacterium]
MEDTIETWRYDPFKGQAFRITFKGQDYQLKLLKREIKTDQTEIDILLDGMEQKLIKKDGIWLFENSEVDQEFANDIWRAISLRYRI